jgi:DNA polymerase lambda
MRDNVDSSLVKSHSIGKSGRPAQGPSSATSISGFLPQATSTQFPATPAGPVSVQNKVANYSRSKVTPKRDRVLKLTPRHKGEADVSNITTPNATGVSISTAPDAGISSSVLPRAGASNTKPVIAKDKKLTTSKSKKKEKELVTPLAYARILCNKLDVLAKKTDFLKGKRLFYTGGDMQYASQSTKKKMELVRFSSFNLNQNFPPTYFHI